MKTKEAKPAPGSRSVNATLLRLLLRARVQLTKLELRAFRRDVIPVLVALRAELVAAVEGAARKKKTLGEVSKRQVGTALRQIDKAIANASKEMQANLDRRLSSIAKREVRILKAAVNASAGELGSVFSGLSAAEIANVVKKNQTAIRAPIGEVWSKKTADVVKKSVALSVAKGEDLDAATRRLSKAADFSKRQAAKVARTSIQRNAAEVTAAAVAKNRSLFKGAQFVATLDLDTCPVCGNLDGNVYTFERDSDADGLYEDRPDIPVHPYCRCVYVPLAKSWRELGIDRDELSPGKRASMDGEVPETVTYDEWIADAAAMTRPTWIRSVLSPARLAVFESGGELVDFSPEVAAWSSEFLRLPPMRPRGRSRSIESALLARRRFSAALARRGGN